MLEKVIDKINKYNLPLNTTETLDLINQYQNSNLYPNKDILQLFYHIVLNKVGSILSKHEDELSEILGWLTVEKYYYQFEDEELYYTWLQSRKYLFEKITDFNDIKLINFMELNIINFALDNKSKFDYDIVDSNLNYIISEIDPDISVKTFAQQYSEKYLLLNYIYKPTN